MEARLEHWSRQGVDRSPMLWHREVVQDYHKLQVWQRSHQLGLRVYRYTARFPREERFVLVPQMRRSAASVATNIVEGCGRPTPADFSRFLTIAISSISELHYQLELARDLELGNPADNEAIRREAKEIWAMLRALRDRVRGER